MTTEKAVLAGGCFWGMQDMFRRLRGVVSTRAGYTGGDSANPSYGNHEGRPPPLLCAGTTERRLRVAISIATSLVPYTHHRR